MKEKIHPTYHAEVLVHCACGETFYTRSTRKEIRVEICSKCHPFFTGKQKLIDSAGRVERFQRRYGKEAGTVAEAAARPAPVKKASSAAKAAEAARAADSARVESAKVGKIAKAPKSKTAPAVPPSA